MKKKKISLFCMVLSLLVALAYIALAVVLAFRAINAKEYTPTADSSLWIMTVLKRLKAAGFNIFFSIMGIVLSCVLALYRFTLAYFYFKVYKSDDVFYKARLGEIVFFSILSAFVICVTSWLCWGWNGILPIEVQPFIFGLFLAYIFLCGLPLLEIILVYLSKILEIKPKQEVPTRKGIIQELDELADKTAEQIVGMHEEKKVRYEEQKVEQPVCQPSVPRVRKVVAYVTSFWDIREDTASQEIKTVELSKLGIRKKNRKPKYNNAKLRIRKPISHKKRLKTMSPVKIKLRYKKASANNRFSQNKRR